MLPTKIPDLAKVPFIPADGLSDFPELLVGQSTRHGGVSPEPYDSLNLGWFTPDSSGHISENRKIFFKSLEWPTEAVAESRQIHGDQVAVVDRPQQLEGYDGLVTQTVGLSLAITVADCCPILVYDPTRKVIGAAHAGWKGSHLGLASKLVASMTHAFGCAPENIHAWIGICITRPNYEVDADVADLFLPQHKTWNSKRGKYLLDIRTVNTDVLIQAGLRSDRIHQTSFGSYSHPEHFFSHRHSKGNTGRGLAVIGLRPGLTQ